MDPCKTTADERAKSSSNLFLTKPCYVLLNRVDSSHFENTVYSSLKRKSSPSSQHDSEAKKNKLHINKNTQPEVDEHGKELKTTEDNLSFSSSEKNDCISISSKDKKNSFQELKMFSSNELGNVNSDLEKKFGLNSNSNVPSDTNVNVRSSSSNENDMSMSDDDASIGSDPSCLRESDNMPAVLSFTSANYAPTSPSVEKNISSQEIKKDDFVQGDSIHVSTDEQSNIFISNPIDKGSPTVWEERLPPPPGCETLECQSLPLPHQEPSAVKLVGDLFEAEYEINDLPNDIMDLLLHKGISEGEISEFSGAFVWSRGLKVPPEERCNLPKEQKPFHLFIQGLSKNTVELAIKWIKNFIQEAEKRKLENTVPTEKIIVVKIPVWIKKDEPRFDLVNRVLGPDGVNLGYIAQETGAEVTIHGSISGNLKPSSEADASEPLHIRIEHKDVKILEEARTLALHLVKTIQQEFEEFIPKLEEPIFINPFLPDLSIPPLAEQTKKVYGAPPTKVVYEAPPQLNPVQQSELVPDIPSQNSNPQILPTHKSLNQTVSVKTCQNQDVKTLTSSISKPTTHTVTPQSSLKTKPLIQNVKPISFSISRSSKNIVKPELMTNHQPIEPRSSSIFIQPPPLNFRPQPPTVKAPSLVPLNILPPTTILPTSKFTSEPTTTMVSTSTFNSQTPSNPPSQSTIITIPHSKPTFQSNSTIVSSSKFVSQPSTTMVTPSKFTSQPPTTMAKPSRFTSEPPTILGKTSRFTSQPPAVATPSKFQHSSAMVTSSKFTSQPPTTTVKPSRFTSQPPAVATPSKSQHSSAMVTPSKFTSQPPTTTVKPSRFTSEPSAIMVKPSNITSEPRTNDMKISMFTSQFPLLATSSDFISQPSTAKVAPSKFTLQPPSTMVNLSRLTAEPSTTDVKYSRFTSQPPSAVVTPLKFTSQPPTTTVYSSGFTSQPPVIVTPSTFESQSPNAMINPSIFTSPHPTTMIKPLKSTSQLLSTMITTSNLTYQSPTPMATPEFTFQPPTTMVKPTNFTSQSTSVTTPSTFAYQPPTTMIKPLKSTSQLLSTMVTSSELTSLFPTQVVTFSQPTNTLVKPSRFTSEPPTTMVTPQLLSTMVTSSERTSLSPTQVVSFSQPPNTLVKPSRFTSEPPTTMVTPLRFTPQSSAFTPPQFTSQLPPTMVEPSNLIFPPPIDIPPNFPSQSHLTMSLPPNSTSQPLSTIITSSPFTFQPPPTNIPPPNLTFQLPPTMFPPPNFTAQPFSSIVQPENFLTQSPPTVMPSSNISTQYPSTVAPPSNIIYEQCPTMNVPSLNLLPQYSSLSYSSHLSETHHQTGFVSSNPPASPTLLSSTTKSTQLNFSSQPPLIPEPPPPFLKKYSPLIPEPPPPLLKYSPLIPEPSPPLLKYSPLIPEHLPPLQCSPPQMSISSIQTPTSSLPMMTPSLEIKPQETSFNERVKDKMDHNETDSEMKHGQAGEESSSLKSTEQPDKNTTVMQIVSHLQKSIEIQINRMPAGHQQTQLKQIVSLLEYTKPADGNINSMEDQYKKLLIVMELLEKCIQSTSLILSIGQQPENLKKALEVLKRFLKRETGEQDYIATESRKNEPSTQENKQLSLLTTEESTYQVKSAQQTLSAKTTYQFSQDNSLLSAQEPFEHSSIKTKATSQSLSDKSMQQPFETEDDMKQQPHRLMELVQLLEIALKIQANKMEAGEGKTQLLQITQLLQQVSKIQIGTEALEHQKPLLIHIIHLLEKLMQTPDFTKSANQQSMKLFKIMQFIKLALKEPVETLTSNCQDDGGRNSTAIQQPPLSQLSLQAQSNVNIQPQHKTDEQTFRSSRNKQEKNVLQLLQTILQSQSGMNILAQQPLESPYLVPPSYAQKNQLLQTLKQFQEKLQTQPSSTQTPLEELAFELSNNTQHAETLHILQQLQAGSQTHLGMTPSSQQPSKSGPFELTSSMQASESFQQLQSKLKTESDVFPPMNNLGMAPPSQQPSKSRPFELTSSMQESQSFQQLQGKLKTQSDVFSPMNNLGMAPPSQQPSKSRPFELTSSMQASESFQQLQAKLKTQSDVFSPMNNATNLQPVTFPSSNQRPQISQLSHISQIQSSKSSQAQHLKDVHPEPLKPRNQRPELVQLMKQLQYEITMLSSNKSPCKNKTEQNKIQSPKVLQLMELLQQVKKLIQYRQKLVLQQNSSQPEITSSGRDQCEVVSSMKLDMTTHPISSDMLNVKRDFTSNTQRMSLAQSGETVSFSHPFVLNSALNKSTSSLSSLTKKPTGDSGGYKININSSYLWTEKDRTNSSYSRNKIQSPSTSSSSSNMDTSPFFSLSARSLKAMESQPVFNLNVKNAFRSMSSECKQDISSFVIHRLVVATWNVTKVMSIPEKYKKIDECLTRRNVDLACIQGLNMNSGPKSSENYSWWSTGTSFMSQGVVFLLRKSSKASLTNFIAHSGFVASVNVDFYNLSFKVVGCHLPDSSSAAFPLVSTCVSSVLSEVPPHSQIILLGDFRACIGKSDSRKYPENLIGKHLFHNETNKNGRKLIEWSVRHKLCVATTFQSDQSAFQSTQFAKDMIPQTSHVSVKLKPSQTTTNFQWWEDLSSHAIVACSINVSCSDST